MSEHYTIWLVVLVLALTFGAVFLVDAQTTNVERDFNFTGNNSVYNLDGISIGTTTVTSGALRFSDGTTFTASDAAASWTSTSTGIFYNDGRVGIGTENPNNQLHVTGPIYGTILYDQDNTSWLVNPSGQSYFSGNLGIGTTTPSRQLEIFDDGSNGQAIMSLTGQSTDLSGIFFADSDDSNIGGIRYFHSDNSMRFRVNDSEPLRIDSNGNVDMNGNDINNADKIDANTVDPVYNIGRTKYATYMAGMTGVKEETTGEVRP